MPSILITGANRGIGLELTKEYLLLGWTVYATCRDPANALALQAIKQSNQDLLYIYSLDVTKDQHIAHIKSELLNTPIDILFNNAAMYPNKASGFGELDRKIWLESFDVNVISPTKVMEAFADNVANSDKKIMANMSSKMGSISDNISGGTYYYRSTKAALNMVTMSASHNLRMRGITVLALHPGWVRTDMGGPNAEISVKESASGLLKNLENASLKDSGRFLDIDGSIILW